MRRFKTTERDRYLCNQTKRGEMMVLDVLGEKVDADLRAGDVRLTMGGEPTFVSIDDPHSPEWSIAAIGPAKRAKADELIRRLRLRFAPGGLLHYGEGKWYPGEALPRWAFSLIWRKDGKPLWKNPRLIAVEAALHTPTPDGAQELAKAVAWHLGLTSDHVLPAFEDPTQWMLQEAALPENVDPLDPRLA